MDKKSNEFRGTARCHTLRNFDSLMRALSTTKGQSYDNAIVVKDIMRGFLKGEFKIEEFRGLVEQGIDSGSTKTESQKQRIIDRLTALLTRAANGEAFSKRNVEFPERQKIGVKFNDEIGYNILVGPDAMFRYNPGGRDFIEGVIYRAGKPNITQTGSKKDGAAKNCIELYLLMLYLRTFVKPGEHKMLRASYYFLRKTTDTSTAMIDQSFFSGQGGNVVFLEEDYCGGEEDTALDEQFKPILADFIEGETHCSEEDCKNCMMHMQCSYQKTPEPFEKKTLVGKKGEIVPSPAQLEIINFREGYAKVNAGAGTGKTETMTERGARMFAEGTDPHKMLFITFTDAGAYEMKERLEKKCAGRNLPYTSSDIQAMTFNAFAFNIVQDNYEELGFSKVPMVIDNVRRSVIITNLLNENEIPGLDYLNFTMDTPSCKGALACVGRAFDIIKQEEIDVEDDNAPYTLVELVREEGLNRFIMDSSCSDIIRLYKKFDALLKEECLVQFADQEPLMNKVLEMHPDYLENLGFEHIVVDEFQDSNDVQLETIKKLCATNSFKSLMVVGDDSQAIFSFRHTSPENIIHFFEKMNVTGKEMFLTENRRSTDEIIDLSNKVNDLNTNKVDKVMISTNGHGQKPMVQGFHKKTEEYSWIADKIEAKISEGIAPEEIAFIAFTKNELINMGAELSKRGIPWIMKNPLPLMENSRVLAAISLGMAFYDPEATQNYFNYLVALHDGELFNKFTSEEIVQMVNDLKEEFYSLDNMTFEQQQAIFHQKLDAIKGTDEIYQYFLSLVYANQDFSAELEYIKNFRDFGEKECKKMEQSYAGVVLTTAHSSKGLEWKVVFNSLTGYDKESLHKNSRRSKERIEEVRRLLFVSVTRAKEQLFVTGQYVAYGPKDNRTYNQFLKNVYDCLGEKYDPVDHEAEKEKQLKEVQKQIDKALKKKRVA